MGQIYFWTTTINKWYHLLKADEYKKVVLSSLNYLSEQGKIAVYAFVLIPNHIHLNPVESFLKYTANAFKKLLKKEGEWQLNAYKVQAANKKYEFWQRDPLAVHLYSPVAYQKLDYLHANPVSERWNLASEPCDYKFPSARFYELGIRDFEFIKDLRNEIG